MDFRTAAASDVPQIVALVESAYRGEASRVGWTTEADLLQGQRTDPEGVADIIASGKGHVVQLRVPNQELVLSALFDNDATVGHALAVTRTFAQKMAELLA